MDESSAVLPSPDAADFGDDSSGISATDFHVPSRSHFNAALFLNFKITDLLWAPT
jgi:hypothetical protein